MRVWKGLLMCGAICVLGVGMSACDDVEKTYSLNQTEIFYEIGSDFSELGLYLVCDQDASEKILVTKEMIYSQSALENPCEDVATMVVYNDVFYSITVNVTEAPPAPLFSAEIMEFLQSYNAKTDSGSVKIDISLDTKYLDKEGEVNKVFESGLRSSDYITNLLFEYAKSGTLELGKNEQWLEKTDKASEFSVKVASVLEELKALEIAFDKEKAHEFAKNCIDFYVLTESDDFYIDLITNYVVSTCGLNADGKVAMRDAVATNFAHFKNVEWEKVDILGLANLVMDEKYWLSETPETASARTIIASAQDALESLEPFEANSISSALAALEPIWLDQSRVLKYESAKEIEGVMVYYGAEAKKISDENILNKLSEFAGARVGVVAEIERLLTGQDVKTTLLNVQTHLAGMMELNAFFVDNNVLPCAGVLDKALFEHKLIQGFEFKDGDYIPYIILENGAEKFGAGLESAKAVIDKLVEIANEEGNVHENLAFYVIDSFVLTDGNFEMWASELATALELGDEGKEEIKALLVGALGGLEDFSALVAVDTESLITDILEVAQNYGTVITAEMVAMVEEAFNKLDTLKKIYSGEIDAKALLVDKVCQIFGDEVLAHLEKDGLENLTAGEKAWVKELVALGVKGESLKEFLLKDEATFKTNAVNVLTKYLEKTSTTEANGWVTVNLIPDIKSGGGLTNAIAYLDANVVRFCSNQAVKAKFAKDIEYLQMFGDYADGEITLHELLDNLNAMDWAMGKITTWLGEYGVELGQEDKNLLENIVWAVVDKTGASDYIIQNKEVLADKLATWLEVALGFTAQTAHAELKAFIADTLVGIATGELDISASVGEFLALVDKFAPENISANIHAGATALSYAASFVTGLEVDYNKIFEYVELPEYIESIDYNVLIAKLSDGQSYADIVKVTNATLSFIEDNGAVTEQVLNITFGVAFDFSLVALKGDISLEIRLQSSGGADAES